MAFPFLLGALLAGYAGEPMLGALVGAYGLYLFRAGSYGYMDGSLYGSELEHGAGALVPRFPDGSTGWVRFPGSLLHVVLRLGATMLLGFLLAFTGAMAHQAGLGGEAFDPLPLLSRPSKVFVLVGGEGERFSLTEVEGKRAAVAHTDWEAVRAGPALQLSPHDLLERALADPEVEAVLFDPGKLQFVVRRAEFNDLKLRLPLWQTPVMRLEKSR
jgi:hypothetical protein